MFLKLFRPHRIIPNTLDPGLENLDWVAIDNMFSDCLSSHGKSVVESIREDVAKKMTGCGGFVKLDSWAELAGNGEKGDTVLKNLEGGKEAVDLATRWMTVDGQGLKKLQRIREHLPESLKIHLEMAISMGEARIQALLEERLGEESQERSEQSTETEDWYDDRGNTAHRIFAGSSFVRSERSSSAPGEEEAEFYTPFSSPRKFRRNSRSLTASPTPPSTIFDREYADWFKPITPPKQQFMPLPKTPEPKKTMNVLSPSINGANAVRLFAAAEPRPAATENHTSQTPLPFTLAPTLSLANTSTAPTLSSGPTKRGRKTPPSASTIARRDERRAEREERRRTALKLCRARPDLVSKEFTEKFLGSVQEESR